MVKIRLRRTGAKKKPQYRVVVADSRAPRDGGFIEIIGHFNPRTEPSTVKIHEDRALYWLSVGAQPTDPVKKLLQNLGTLERFARLKQGADLEGLLAEATATRETSNVEIQPKAKKVAAEKVEEEVKAQVVASQNEETSTEAPLEDTPVETEEEASTDEDKS
jgi:small subunit ribosomal protein S16